jgi:hypothetical protein
MAGALSMAPDARGRSSLHFPCTRATLFIGRQVLGVLGPCEKAGGYLLFTPKPGSLAVRPSLLHAQVRPTHVQVWTRIDRGLTLTYAVLETGGSLLEGRLRIQVPARKAARVSLAEVLMRPSL